MEKNITVSHSASDNAIATQIGAFLQQTRLTQNKTQQEIAKAAGIHRTTLVQLEKGNGGTLHTLIRVLRTLNQLQLFDTFQVSKQISPLQLAKLEQAKRQRATSKKNTGTEKGKAGW
jgi:transcriptional regulator with XRE-family HTH domain